jgi:hypothetical protein
MLMYCRTRIVFSGSGSINVVYDLEPLIISERISPKTNRPAQHPYAISDMACTSDETVVRYTKRTKNAVMKEKVISIFLIWGSFISI